MVNTHITGLIIATKTICFMRLYTIPKEPYTDHEIGGMLAYAVTDDKAIWLTRIEERPSRLLASPGSPSSTKAFTRRPMKRYSAAYLMWCEPVCGTRFWYFISCSNSPLVPDARI